MNFKYILLKAIIIFVAAASIISACTKPNEEEPVEESKEDRISGRTVRYTLMVVNAATGGMKSATGIDSAIVSLVMNDSIYNVATDSNGIAKFNNLAAGMLAVKISHPEYATTSMIVDITAQKDEKEYDAKNIRNASSIVELFPRKGENTATISGKAWADLDLTKTGLENAVEGLKISSHISQKQLVNYVNHTGAGKIISIVCKTNLENATTDAQGNYTINVPASRSGLKIVLVSDDFVYSQKTVQGTQRHIYKAKHDTLTVFSGMKSVHDIKYE